MAAGISGDEFRAYAALLASSTLLQRAVERNLREQANLSQVQFEILMNLSIAGDSGIRMAQLADSLIVSRSGLSYQVAQLESRRWITRERSSDDERGVLARITPAGDRMRKRVFAGHVDIVRRAFLDVVGPDELTTLTAVLERVAGRLRNGGSGDEAQPPADR
jgi:DNA-binding MarR family transcriptional regulator